MSEKPLDFEPIEDQAEGIKFLKEGAKTLAQGVLWTQEQKLTLDTRVTVVSDTEKTFYIWSAKDKDLKSLAQELKLASQGDFCFFNLTLHRANIFFKARLKGFDTGGIYFEWPEKVFKVQRRKDMRFTIPDGYVLFVEFEDPKKPGQILSRKLIDISASGLAFLGEPKDSTFWDSGNELRRVQFTIRSRKITTDAEIRHAIPKGERGHAKVGLSFKGLKAADAQWIASYVFEEGRKFISRFM